MMSLHAFVSRSDGCCVIPCGRSNRACRGRLSETLTLTGTYESTSFDQSGSPPVKSVALLEWNGPHARQL
jgi:hypothetical protein